MTEELANRMARLSAGALPEADTALIKRALLDTVGVGVAGWRLPTASIVWSALELANTPGTGRVIGTSKCVAPTAAALMNGVLGHAQLFDDTNGPMIGHPSAPLVAALLALGPQAAVGASELLKAYAIGFDTSVLLGRLLNPEHYERGWHATATLGIFGATATSCVLLRCSPRQTVSALGIAASLASGLRQNFGSMTMALHAGAAAQGAVTAALLARREFSASPFAIEGKYGFIEAFGGSEHGYDFSSPATELARSGIQFKLFPSGAPTQCAIEAALEVARAVQMPIESVTCWVDSWSAKTLKNSPPDDATSAKVNLRFCVASALIKQRLTLDDFDPASLTDSRVADLMPRIIVKTDPLLEGRGLFPARLEVRCAAGTLSAACFYPMGSPERPALDRDLVAKFVACLEPHVNSHDASAHAQRILALEQEPSDELFDSLVVCDCLEKVEDDRGAGRLGSLARERHHQREE